MKSKKLKRQKVITNKKKKLSTGSKGQGKDSPISKNSTQGKNKKTKGIKPFPIVAIGASAGGIEAISNLLENLSPKLGMAYVIIQHLAPDHESILPELLERKTSMHVHQVEDGMEVKANNVYVIPPNTYMSITDGHLRLSPRIKSDGVYHSIDFFLNALAPVYKNKAIAVILSGSASDGSIGVQAIKAEGGITFAQDDSAKFMSMPLSAIDSGFIDFILSPKEIAKQLEWFPKIIYSIAADTQSAEGETSKTELKKIFFLLHNKHGVDFSYYKPSTINRRIQRRMLLHRKTKPGDYIKLLQQNADEVELLYRDLLINVTSFFRDPGSYAVLVKKIFPALIKGRNTNNALRIWIPACASGEETYSIAICLFESLKGRSFSAPLQIFATDLNEKAIEKARAGVYSKGSLENVSPKRLKDYFIKKDGNYQIIKAIRDICVFAPHNLLKDPPFSRMDLISCKNVMIYLENIGQKKILTNFHYALKPAGYLLLGRSETISSSQGLFTIADKENKVYKRKEVETNGNFTIHPHYYPREPIPDKKSQAPVISDNGIDKEIEKILLSRYIPASVVVDKDMQVQRFLGTASHYLQPASGKASLHLLKLVRNELVYELQSLVYKARKENKAVRKEGIVISDNGQSKEMEIEVTPLKTSSSDPHYFILFKESKLPLLPIQKDKSKKDQKNTNEKRSRELEQELADTRQHLKMISEEFEAASEELQSSNEEALSSNEELQSMNEELETSKEELQSTNEELITINEELQNRNIELKDVGEYKKAIIETIHESLIILSVDLRVKSANKGFYTGFRSKPEDTEGRYLFELGNHQWDIPELRRQLSQVQTKNIELVNFEVDHKFLTIGQKIMQLNAQRIPMGENDALILLAIEDITEKRIAENKLKESEERFRLLLQNAFDIITIFDPDGTILYESPAIETVLGYTPEERVGKNILLHSLVHPDDKKKKIEMLEKAIATPGENINVEFRLQHKNGSYRTIDAVCRNMLDDTRIKGIIATYRDITERKMLEQQKDDFIGIASHELKTPVTSIKAYSQILQDVFSKAHDKKSVELLHKMETQVDRLNVLIVDLLDFTRIEGGKLKFREESYTMNELINEVVEEMQRTTKTHKLILKLGRSAKMYGDRYRVGQVVTNIISNAIKYSPNGKEIIITSKMANETVAVSIQDFGVGIHAKLVAKVFDKFFRVTEPVLNTFPGLGLGLYIAAEIIQRQGGKIWAKSTVGKGSTFSFSLPVKG
jgi:two-component system CheB/CheR fusion protein